MHAPRPWQSGYACALVLSALARPALADPPQPEPAPPPSATAEATPAVRDEVPPSPLLVTRRFARAAVRAALAAARQTEAWARLSSLETRARTSALLPDLAVRVARNTDASLRLSPTVDEPYNYSAAGGVGWWLEGRLTWHWDRLVFDTHELAVERLRMEQVDRTGKLVAKVLQTLFAWQRAARRAEDPKTTPEDQERAELERAEAEIVLDQLTGGWFGGELARRLATE